MALVDKVAKRVIDGNQKDEEESRSPCAVDNAEHQIGEGDKRGEGEFVPCASDLGVEMLAMMVELVVCFLPAGKRLAVDGDGAVVIGMHAMSIVLKRIDMQSAWPHMDLFTLALVSHMDAIPANMNLFALVGINNVDAAREGNIDKWLIAAISVLSRSLQPLQPYLKLWRRRRCPVPHHQPASRQCYPLPPHTTAHPATRHTARRAQ